MPGMDDPAFARSEGCLVEIADTQKPEAAGNPRRQLEAQRRAADRTEMGRRGVQDPVRLRLCRRHVDQTSRAIHIEAWSILRPKGRGCNRNQSRAGQHPSPRQRTS